MTAFGLKKVKDLLAYDIECTDTYVLPYRFLRLTETISKKYGIRMRALDRKHLERDVKIILDVGNESTSPNWGYVPVTDAEAHAIARSMKTIVDPDIIMIAEVGDRPIGTLIVFPDVNTILKDLNGRLFPTGFIKVISGRRKIAE